VAAGEIERALALLFPPGSVVEVRAFTEEGTASGYFSDTAALAAAASALDSAGTSGIYVTLNEVNPALLSRRSNRIKMRLSRRDATTADADIVSRRWFPVDIDPARPSGVSSTDAEHQSALARARQVAGHLAGRGWPEPVLADSGNGAHLLYRVELPNDEESRSLVKRALEALDRLFPDGTCTIDAANFNAARIWKLYGTTSRKGDHTPDRPHRKAALLAVPDPVCTVERRLLEELAASVPPAGERRGSSPVPREWPGRTRQHPAPPKGSSLDLREWLLRHGIGISGEKPYAGGTLFVLESCPFSESHRDGAFAIQFPGGAIHAGCHHASCGGGSQRWQELRARFEAGEIPGGPTRESPRRERGVAGGPPAGLRRTSSLPAGADDRWAGGRIPHRGRAEGEAGSGDGSPGSPPAGNGTPRTGTTERDGPPGTCTPGGSLPGDGRAEDDGLPGTSPPGAGTRGWERGGGVLSARGEERGSLAGETARGEDPFAREEALAILQHGDPKQAMLRAFSLDHEGDGVVAECLVLSLASRSVLNTNGLHVSVTGESGKGKSHAFATMLRQVPERFRLDGAMSNKALFYIEGLQPGSVIVLDDRALSEEMAEILKGVTTSFRTPFVYRTVNRDRRAQVCTIPERCVWWVAKVEGAGDDQVFNRMLTCWIDDSGEQDARVLARILARDQEVPGGAGGERPEVLVCREMWEVIGRERFHVVIPFATRIRFQAAANRRNPEMLLDLVKANAVLRFLQREGWQQGGIACLSATLDDFREAARLYGFLNGTAGGQETKLTRREADLLAAIREHRWPEFTIPMLQKATGLAHGAIYKCLHGHTTRGRVYSGLLEKCPAIAYCDRTVVTDEEGGSVSMRRRTNAYTFDPDLYALWCMGGAVWLEGDGQDPGSPATPAPPCNDPATRIAGNGNGGEPSDEGSTENTLHNSPCREDPFHGSAGSQYPSPEGLRGAACGCVSGTVAEQDPGTQGFRPVAESAMGKPTSSLLQGPAAGAGCCRDAGDRAVSAHDYKPLVPPERTGCFACGAEWSYYVEKLTDERRRRKDQTARRICKRCFDRAKRFAKEHATILPGTFDLSRMEHLKNEVGRCSICRLDPATRIDRATSVKVCEACFRRVAGEQGGQEVRG